MQSMTEIERISEHVAVLSDIDLYDTLDTLRQRLEDEPDRPSAASVRFLSSMYYRELCVRINLRRASNAARLLA